MILSLPYSNLHDAQIAARAVQSTLDHMTRDGHDVLVRKPVTIVADHDVYCDVPEYRVLFRGYLQRGLGQFIDVSAAKQGDQCGR